MTEVRIDGEKFLINGEPTYRGQSFRGRPVEGLLMNSRMVQATFDDENPETRPRWAYPDTGAWDPERNVREFVAALPAYRVHELIERVKGVEQGGRRLPVGTSYGGGTVPGENVVRASDFLLIHGNGVKDPKRIAEMVDRTREVPGYRPMPILFNEDDHYDFERPENNFVAAVSRYASWGLLDIGQNNYRDGFQCPPVDWSISTERKRAFCDLLKEMTGG